MPLTADDVNNVAFSKAPMGHSGYDEDQVDAFLDRAGQALLQPDSLASGSLTPAEVQAARFAKPPIGKRGYHQDEVDTFLDLVADELGRRQGRPLSALEPTSRSAAVEPTGEQNERPRRGLLSSFFRRPPEI